MSSLDIKKFVDQELNDTNIIDKINKLYDGKSNTKHEPNNLQILHNQYNQFYELKKRLQININLHNEYELYRDCRIHDHSSTIINDIDIRSGREIIEEMIGDYIAHFGKILHLEKLERERIESASLMNGGNCAICGTDILAGERQCSTCQEPFLGRPCVVNSNEKSIDYPGKSDRRTKSEFSNENPGYGKKTCDKTNRKDGNGVDLGNRGEPATIENPNKEYANKDKSIDYPGKSDRRTKTEFLNEKTNGNGGNGLDLENRGGDAAILEKNEIHKDQRTEPKNKINTNEKIENENIINKVTKIDESKRDPMTENENKINQNTEIETEKGIKEQFKIMEENKINRENESRFNEKFEIEEANKIKANAKIENESKINECKAIDNHLNHLSNTKKPFDILSTHKDEWLCESCEFLNSYQFQHCSICVKPRLEFGLWICMGCSFVNEMRFSNCRVCEAVNELNKSKVEAQKNSFDYSMIPEEKHSASQDKRKHKKKEKSPPENFDHSTKYRCWNRACNQFIDGTSKFCSKCSCKASPESENASGSQESNHEKSDPKKGNQGSWECGKCTFVNQQGKKQCELCNWKKDKIKQNNYINNDQSKYWQCWHKNCKQMNKSELCYCHKCSLYRYGSADDGDIVKCKNKSGIRDIWICASCTKFNDLQDRKCAGKNCRKDRFHKPNSKK